MKINDYLIYSGIVLFFLFFSLLIFPIDSAQKETQNYFCNIKYPNSLYITKDSGSQNWCEYENGSEIRFFKSNSNKICKEEFWKLNDCLNIK